MMTALLELDGVRVVRDGRRVLDGASLALAPGERLALVGDNGAGKTTLLRTLVGLETPEAGRVLAFGRELRGEVDFRAARPRIGFLFQDPDDQLFCPTVLEDVAFGPLNLGRPEAEAFAAARATLDRLGLAALSDRLTHRLSGGEKRLAALAGVLATGAEALLLDEPTNALDARARAALIDRLAGLDAAMILVSHDRDLLARLATRAVALRGGRVAPALIHRHAGERLHVHGLDDDHAHDG
jgi:cobalt/nickel transport system ATP-binding protein